MGKNTKRSLIWFLLALVPVYPFAYAAANDSFLLGVIMIVAIIGSLVASGYFMLRAEDDRE